MLVRDKIRIPPTELDNSIDESLIKQVKEKYTGYISKEMGIVVDVLKIKKTGEGHVIPGDGGVYFESEFDVLTYIPEVSEVMYAKIRDVSSYGAFASLGAIDGMIHISQTMDDFVSFSKDKSLSGRETKRVLKVGDLCISRIIAVSYKEIANPKIGLTMRQKGLGKIEWLEEEPAKKGEESKKGNVKSGSKKKK